LPATELPALAIDIGNTSVKAALLERSPRRIARVDTSPEDTLAQRLAEALVGAEVDTPARVVASSVRPEADDAVRAAVAKIWPDAPGMEFFRSPGNAAEADIQVPIDVAARAPESVGTDRLLLALGARELAGAPCIVVGAGTAVTVDLVGPDGAFAGGAIAPGMGTAADGLSHAAAQLPGIRPGRPAVDVGGDTQEAMTSGVYWFVAGGVLALVSRYRRRPGHEGAPVVLTGGDAETLALPPPRARPDLPRHGRGAGSKLNQNLFVAIPVFVVAALENHPTAAIEEGRIGVVVEHVPANEVREQVQELHGTNPDACADDEEVDTRAELIELLAGHAHHGPLTSLHASGHAGAQGPYALGVTRVLVSPGRRPRTDPVVLAFLLPQAQHAGVQAYAVEVLVRV
jgi:type III pantothenate kinase